jgi:Flp pilus assembly pilin Flp
MWAYPSWADLAGMTPSGRIDRIRSCSQREDAQTMAEYVVVLAVITPAVILAFGLFGSAIGPAIDAVRSFL